MEELFVALLGGLITATLLDANLIYMCGNCGHYHLRPGVTDEQVTTLLDRELGGRRVGAGTIRRPELNLN